MGRVGEGGGGGGWGPSSRARKRRGREVDPCDEIALVVCEMGKLLAAVAKLPGVPKQGPENCCGHPALKGGINLRPPAGEAVAVAPVAPAVVASCCPVELL